MSIAQAVAKSAAHGTPGSSGSGKPNGNGSSRKDYSLPAGTIAIIEGAFDSSIIEGGIDPQMIRGVVTRGREKWGEPAFDAATALREQYGFDIETVKKIFTSVHGRADNILSALQYLSVATNPQDGESEADLEHLIFAILSGTYLNGPEDRHYKRRTGVTPDRLETMLTMVVGYAPEGDGYADLSFGELTGIVRATKSVLAQKIIARNALSCVEGEDPDTDADDDTEE